MSGNVERWDFPLCLSQFVNLLLACRLHIEEGYRTCVRVLRCVGVSHRSLVGLLLHPADWAERSVLGAEEAVTLIHDDGQRESLGLVGA